MNIMISINDKFLNIAKVMLFSLFSNNSDAMDVYLICHNLSENTVYELKKVFGMFEGKRLFVMELGDVAENDIPLYVAYSPEILYKMLGIGILPDNLHKILWLDADMIIKGSLRELYYTNIDNAPMAVCEDINAIINSEAEDFKRRCGIPEDGKYFNAGMCLFNLDYLRSHNIVGVFKDVINQRHKDYYFLEQDALNSMLFDDVVWVPWSLYNVHPSYFALSVDDIADGRIRIASYKEINEQRQHEDYSSRYVDITKYIKGRSKIIHYIGLSKPWREDSSDMYWTQAEFKDIWLDYEKRLQMCLSNKLMQSC